MLLFYTPRFWDICLGNYCWELHTMEKNRICDVPRIETEREVFSWHKVSSFSGKSRKLCFYWKKQRNKTNKNLIMPNIHYLRGFQIWISWNKYKQTFLHGLILTKICEKYTRNHPQMRIPPKATHAHSYLQIIFPKVLVPPPILILIEDRWDFGPLWLWIWLICLQAAIKGAGGWRL